MVDVGLVPMLPLVVLLLPIPDCRHGGARRHPSPRFPGTPPLRAPNRVCSACGSEPLISWISINVISYGSPAGGRTGMWRWTSTMASASSTTSPPPRAPPPTTRSCSGSVVAPDYIWTGGPWAGGTARGTAFWHDPWAARHGCHRARAGTARRPVQCMGRRPGP